MQRTHATWNILIADLLSSLAFQKRSSSNASGGTSRRPTQCTPGIAHAAALLQCTECSPMGFLQKINGWHSTCTSLCQQLTSSICNKVECSWHSTRLAYQPHKWCWGRCMSPRGPVHIVNLPNWLGPVQRPRRVKLAAAMMPT
jgi:hypothetical protein